MDKYQLDFDGNFPTDFSDSLLFIWPMFEVIAPDCCFGEL
jgi:hypothetical protein